MFNYVRNYGFEYLGNANRLVVTPLTLRSQRSLLVALQYCFGGAPEGPFGTGKTETTKDLSRSLGKLCFVINGSASFEYSGIERFFKGIASSGSWVIFDEFNRLSREVLSFLTGTIVTIQSSLKRRINFVQFNEEKKTSLDFDCGIFITMNPNYKGRQALPVNMKNLFRSIQMTVPDSIHITEIALLSSGFINARELARKIANVQKLANVIM